MKIAETIPKYHSVFKAETSAPISDGFTEEDLAPKDVKESNNNSKTLLLSAGILASLGVAGVALYKNKNFKKEINVIKDQLKKSEKNAEELKTKLKTAEENASKQTAKTGTAEKTADNSAKITELEEQNNSLTNENNKLRAQIADLENKSTAKIKAKADNIFKGIKEKEQHFFKKDSVSNQPVKENEKAVQNISQNANTNDLSNLTDKQIKTLRKMVAEHLAKMLKNGVEPVKIKEKDKIVRSYPSKGKIEIKQLKAENPKKPEPEPEKSGTTGIFSGIKSKYQELKAKLSSIKAKKQVSKTAENAQTAETKKEPKLLEYKPSQQADDAVKNTGSVQNKETPAEEAVESAVRETPAEEAVEPAVKETSAENTQKGLIGRLVDKIKIKFYEKKADYTTYKVQKNISDENVNKYETKYQRACEASDKRNAKWLAKQHKIKEREYKKLFDEAQPKESRLKKFKTKMKEFWNSLAEEPED